MSSNFANSTVLAVRRQVDNDRKSVSLLRFLAELKEFPSLISREYHRTLYHRPEFPDGQAAVIYDDHVGKGLTELNVDTVQQEIDSLKAAAQRLQHYADRRVAHFDTRGPEGPTPKFDDLTNCLALIEKLVLRYLMLLKGVSQSSLLPPYDYDWKAIFRIPWATDRKKL